MVRRESSISYYIGFLIGIAAIVVGIFVEPGWLFIGFGAGTILSLIYLMGRGARGRPAGLGAIFERLGAVELAVIVVAYAASFVVAYLVFS